MIFFDENIAWVISGKGNKDRPFIIPQKIKKELERECKKENFGCSLGEILI